MVKFWSNKDTIGLLYWLLLLILHAFVILAQVPETSPQTLEKRPKHFEGGSVLATPMKVLKKLMRKYDWRIRPSGVQNVSDQLVSTSGPVIVTVNVYLRTISKVDDVNMEYSAHFTFREEWFDTRLAFENLNSNLPQIILPQNTNIWMPDTFFQNEKEGRFHDINKPNVLLRIRPDGHILYSVRLTLMLSCPMNLQNYPLDTQTCLIDLASYAYTTKDIHYQWKTSKPVQIKQGLNSSLPSFVLSNVSTALCTSSTTTGNYSCLRLILSLKREFSYYLLQLYIPSFMLVGVSWVSFWLDKDSVPARVTLGVTTLLTMTTQASGINAKLPPVSYTKAVDVWIGVCLAFIFGALLEFALVNYAARKDMMDQQRRKLSKLVDDIQPTSVVSTEITTAVCNCHADEIVQLDDATSQPPRYAHWSIGFTDSRYSPISDSAQSTPRLRRRPKRRSGWNLPLSSCKLPFVTPSFVELWRWFMQTYDTRAKKIDVLSRFLFPVAFTAFNALYWHHYLIPYLRDSAEEL